MKQKLFKVLVLVLILSLALPLTVSAGVENAKLAAAGDITFTILHTNDFHGYLEFFDPAPGAARLATKINEVRTAVGADNVLLMDAGDEMQGYILSNWFHGESTIDVFNKIGYQVATFGNHEFDWGKTTLGDRLNQATYPFLSANITAKVGDSCAGWDAPQFTGSDGLTTYTVQPYQIFTVGTAPNTVKVGVIGVTTTETPTIVMAGAVEGLCFKDPATSIGHYWQTVRENSDVIVVLSHLGYTDTSATYYGDQTLATKLNANNTPVDLIVGGHSHTNLSPSDVKTFGKTKVVTAHYNGRKLGRADITFNTVSKTITGFTWTRIDTSPTPPVPLPAEDPTIKAAVDSWANDSGYQSVINEPIGYTQVDLSRNYNGDQMMGAFIQDAIYNQLNSNTEPGDDVDMVFNNAGGIRVDLCKGGASCVPGLLSEPRLLTYGMMYSIMPFGNLVTTGTMTGAQIIELLNQSATLYKGALQVGGIRYKFYHYGTTLPASTWWAWGAFDIQVYNRSTETWDPLDPSKTYKIATNNFLAPAGQDGYTPFKYIQNVAYWGDMLDVTNAWVKTAYPDAEHAFTGYTPEGGLDGRITRVGGDKYSNAEGEIVPLTILHHNDSHGNLVKVPYVAYPQLVTLINQERAKNPDRTLLLSAGDNIQGDAMMKFFMTAPFGYSVDGTALAPELQINPLIKAFNFVGYDAMTVGNHEYNFGKDVFVETLKQAEFPILQANVVDTGAYGIDQVPVLPYTTKTVGPEGIKVSILGIGNHRVTNYELPSNIPGLSFPNPIDTAAKLVPELRATSDVVIALTHIGFTEDPKSVEVDTNVDTNLGKTVSGIDAIVGGHSHTSAINGFGPYLWLPTFVGAPDGKPVIIGQAYRYNNTLGEIILGLRAKDAGGYEVVAQTGKYLTVSMSTTEDTAVKNLIQPYADLLTAYQNTPLGETIIPIDAKAAYTQETNSANLQADAAVLKLKTEGIDVDVHLSGAMSNTLIASTATEATPYLLKIKDMYDAMPYENSLLVISMNGPQLKTVLERAYRNYFYYLHVPGRGGYSYYTTCMLDTDSLGRIFYKDTYPEMPNGDNVAGLLIDGNPVDFADAETYYNVSTVNYLAAGSCNFNDGGVTLWPLDQIVADTQYYVRDVVIDYIKATAGGEPINPQVEGRLLFGDTVAPVVTITAPIAKTYQITGSVTLDFGAVDGADGTTPSFAAPSGVKTLVATLNGADVSTGDVVDLYTLPAGDNTLTVTATDFYGNSTTQSVTFNFSATISDVKYSVDQFYAGGQITDPDVYQDLLGILQAAAKSKKSATTVNQLSAFINLVEAQSGKSITTDAAEVLIADANFVIAHLK